MRLVTDIDASQTYSKARKPLAVYDCLSQSFRLTASEISKLETSKEDIHSSSSPDLPCQPHDSLKQQKAKSCLPTISAAFFYQKPPDITKQQYCFIFFGSDVNLPPQPLLPTHFNKEISEAISHQPLESAELDGVRQIGSHSSSALALPSLPTISNYQAMAKPTVDTSETLSTQNAIRQKITLSDRDYKSLKNAAFHFVSRKQDLCKPVPRPWKEKWKSITREFLEDEGRGPQYFSSSRNDYDEESSLLWPEDKDAISFLVFNILKQESSTTFSTKVSKRKSLLLSKQAHTPTKKPKVDPLSALLDASSNGITNGIANGITKGSDDTSEDRDQHSEEEEVEEQGGDNMHGEENASSDRTLERRGDESTDSEDADEDDEDEGAEDGGVEAVNDHRGNTDTSEPKRNPSEPMRSVAPAGMPKQGTSDVQGLRPLSGNRFPLKEGTKQGYRRQLTSTLSSTRDRSVSSIPPSTKLNSETMQHDDGFDVDYDEFLQLPDNMDNMDNFAVEQTQQAVDGICQTNTVTPSKHATKPLVKNEGHGQPESLLLRSTGVFPSVKQSSIHSPLNDPAWPVNIDVVYSLIIIDGNEKRSYMHSISASSSFSDCVGRFICGLQKDEDRVIVACSSTCILRGPGSFGSLEFPLRKGNMEGIWRSIIKKICYLVAPGGPNENEMIEVEFAT